MPQGLKDVGVLLEPMTVVQKGVTQAYEFQRRLKVWRPKRAAVMGTGTLGLLATLVLPLRGLEVAAFGRKPKPYLNAELVEALGARYVNTADPADRINLDFVLGNRVMVGSVNASRENFETGVRDMAQAEAEYPGWLRQLLTDPVRGLENYRELFERLHSPNGAIKIYCEVS